MMKRTPLALGIVLLVLMLSGAGYWTYQGTPPYALGQIESAIKDGNRLRFQQYVDLDTFLPSAVDQLMNQAVLESAGDGDGSGMAAVGNALGAAIADRFKPAMVQVLRTAILDGIAEGKVEEVFAAADADDEGGPSADNQTDISRIGTATGATPESFVGIGKITKEGDVALVDLLFREAHLDTTLALQLRMERQNRRWRVVAPENLASYLKKVDELKEAKLTALNEGQRTEAAKHLRVGTPTRTSQRLYSLTSYDIAVPVENIGEEPIHLRLGRMHSPDGEDTEIILSDKDRLEPGESTTMETTLLQGSSLSAPIFFRTGNLSEADVDLTFVIGEEGAARYVGPYETWDAYLARQEDPAEFAERVLATRAQRGDDSPEDLLERADIGPWIVNEDTNPLDDSPIVTLVTRAAEGRSSFGQTPSLVLRCRDNTTEVYINWQDYLGSDRVVVSSRIGDQDMRRQRWSLSTDNRATFYPGNDIQFINSLLGADRFVARVTPYSESPVTAVFELNGLADHIGKIQRACNWN